MFSQTSGTFASYFGFSRREPDMFAVPQEQTSPAQLLAGFMEKMRAHPEVMVRINMDPRPMTSKNFEAVKKEVDRVLELANNRDKVCIGTGCLPYETDPQMVLKTKEYILSRNVP